MYICDLNRFEMVLWYSWQNARVATAILFTVHKLSDNFFSLYWSYWRVDNQYMLNNHTAIIHEESRVMSIYWMVVSIGWTQDRYGTIFFWYSIVSLKCKLLKIKMRSSWCQAFILAP